MDTVTGWMLVAVTLLFLPLLVTAGFAVVWWRTLERPWLFIVTGSLALFGLFMTVGELLTPAHDAYMFVSGAQARGSTLPEFASSRALTVLVLIALAIPMLFWLRAGLRK